MTWTRKLLLATAASLGLAGCVTSGSVAPPIPSPIVGILPDKIQGAILSTCGLVLDHPTLEAILGTFVPGVDSVVSFASELCRDLTGRSGFITGRTFRGVRLIGHYRRAVARAPPHRVY